MKQKELHKRSPSKQPVNRNKQQGEASLLLAAGNGRGAPHPACAPEVSAETLKELAGEEQHVAYQKKKKLLNLIVGMTGNVPRGPKQAEDSREIQMGLTSFHTHSLLML